MDFSTAHPYQYELEVFQPPENQLMLHKEEVSSNVQNDKWCLQNGH